MLKKRRKVVSEEMARVGDDRIWEKIPEDLEKLTRLNAKLQPIFEIIIKKKMGRDDS